MPPASTSPKNAADSSHWTRLTETGPDPKLNTHDAGFNKINSTHNYVDHKQMNATRRKQIEDAHPEIAELTQPCMQSAFWTVFVVGLQIAIAWTLHKYDLSWWIVGGVSWVVGAVANHALWTLIHELTHSAVFENPDMNLLFHIIANLPIIFPSAISFKYFHGLHHSHLNEAYGDPDLPGPMENKIFGSSPLGKATWLAFFFIVQSLRVLRYSPKWGSLGKWIVANWVVQFAFNGAVLYYLGSKGFTYMLLSSIFSIGLHPVGARWVAEHYSLHPPQETYSYYGPFNFFCFNIGYHNEHHDFPLIPWNNLPKVKALAPEYYDNLWHHTSYARLLWDFIMNPAFTLHSRVVRKPAEKGTKAGAAVEQDSAGMVKKTGKATKAA